MYKCFFVWTIALICLTNISSILDTGQKALKETKQSWQGKRKKIFALCELMCPWDDLKVDYHKSVKWYFYRVTSVNLCLSMYICATRLEVSQGFMSDLYLVFGRLSIVKNTQWVSAHLMMVCLLRQHWKELVKNDQNLFKYELEICRTGGLEWSLLQCKRAWFFKTEIGTIAYKNSWTVWNALPLFVHLCDSPYFNL